MITHTDVLVAFSSIMQYATHQSVKNGESVASLHVYLWLAAPLPPALPALALSLSPSAKRGFLALIGLTHTFKGIFRRGVINTTDLQTACGQKELSFDQAG